MNFTGKVLSVVGPTATGKSNRALQIAQQKIASGEATGVDLISVDSRQVYQGLEILTGADVPEGFEKKSWKILDQVQDDEDSDSSEMLKQVQHDEVRSDMRSSFERFFARHQQYFALKDDSIRLFGVSMINPSEEWSVAHFQQYARAIMIDSWSSNRLPILVGGTGLYHQELFRQDTKLHVPPNEGVRKKAVKMSVEELQKWLGAVDPERLENMNESDRVNPRRLVRAIEISVVENETLKELDQFEKNQIANERSEQQSWKMLKQVQHDENSETPEIADPSPGRGRQVRNDNIPKRDYDYDNIDWSRIEPETVFVTADLDLIKEKIEKRVKERFENGAIEEVKWLLSLKLSPTLPVLTTLGVPEITKFLHSEISAEDCQKLWSLHEFQYAKRQLTWWGKNIAIISVGS